MTKLSNVTILSPFKVRVVKGYAHYIQEGEILTIRSKMDYKGEEYWSTGDDTVGSFSPYFAKDYFEVLKPNTEELYY